MADLLEGLNRHIIELSETIFHPREKNSSKRNLGFQIILRGIGRKEGMITGVQESLVALQRLSGYLIHISLGWKGREAMRERMKSIARDVKSLLGHAEMLSQKIAFLLDATLGMINIEQNGIMQIVKDSDTALLFEPGNALQLAERLVDSAGGRDKLRRMGAETLRFAKARTHGAMHRERAQFLVKSLDLV